jgi:hypothetical protein
MFSRAGISPPVPGFCRAAPEPETVVACFQDVAVVREPVEQGCRHLGIAENAAPLAETQVGGDHDAGALVELAEQVKQQGSARRAERQVAELVQDDEVETEQTIGELPCLVRGLFLLQRIHQVDRGEEPDFLAAVLDGLDAQCRGEMRFAGAGRYSDILLSTKGVW